MQLSDIITRSNDVTEGITQCNDTASGDDTMAEGSTEGADHNKHRRAGLYLPTRPVVFHKPAAHFRGGRLLDKKSNRTSLVDQHMNRHSLSPGRPLSEHCALDTDARNRCGAPPRNRTPDIDAGNRCGTSPRDRSHLAGKHNCNPFPKIRNMSRERLPDTHNTGKVIDKGNSGRLITSDDRVPSAGDPGTLSMSPLTSIPGDVSTSGTTLPVSPSSARDDNGHLIQNTDSVDTYGHHEHIPDMLKGHIPETTNEHKPEVTNEHIPEVETDSVQEVMNHLTLPSVPMTTPPPELEDGTVCIAVPQTPVAMVKSPVGAPPPDMWTAEVLSIEINVYDNDYVMDLWDDGTQQVTYDDIVCEHSK